MRRPRLSLHLALCLAASGCAHGVMNATFLSTETPVLLGPKDRVGATGAPLPVTQVREFESEASYAFTQGERDVGYQRFTVLTETQSSPYRLAQDAQSATNGDPSTDIRLTVVKPVAYGGFGGVVMKEYVVIEGHVVKVGGAK